MINSHLLPAALIALLFTMGLTYIRVHQAEQREKASGVYSLAVPQAALKRLYSVRWQTLVDEEKRRQRRGYIERVPGVDGLFANLLGRARNCRERDIGSCKLLGKQFADHWNVVENREEAARWYGRACQLGSRQGCNELRELGKRHETSTPPDPQAARRTLDRACRMGDFDACATAYRSAKAALLAKQTIEQSLSDAQTYALHTCSVSYGVPETGCEPTLKDFEQLLADKALGLPAQRVAVATAEIQRVRGLASTTKVVPRMWVEL